VSQRAFSLVFERSRVGGSKLLVLLAIADYARNDGRDAWPSAQTLAKRARQTDRNVLNILHALEEEGEIIIEPNVELRRPDEGGTAPRWFLHVRCVCEWEAYQADGQSEKISDSDDDLSPPRAAAAGQLFRRGRPPGNQKTFLISRDRKSENQRIEIRKPAYRNPKSSVSHPYDPRTDPPGIKKQGSATPNLFPDKTPAEECFNVIVKLAHETLEQLGESANEVDLLDDLKRRCFQRHIPHYPPADLAGRALDAAKWQRRARRSSAS
jgi:helix-turn-helix protein